jgi:hypothetical protein
MHSVSTAFRGEGDFGVMFEAIGVFVETHQALFIVIGIVSAALLVTSLVLVPVAVVNLPEDYFVRPKAKPTGRSAALHMALRVIRNVIAAIFIPLGVLLLVLPGPGWLTILLGVELLDIPLKRKLEIKLLSLPVVRNAVNVMRAKRGKQPLQFPEKATEAQRTQRGKE